MKMRKILQSESETKKLKARIIKRMSTTAWTYSQKSKMADMLINDMKNRRNI